MLDFFLSLLSILFLCAYVLSKKNRWKRRRLISWDDRTTNSTYFPKDFFYSFLLFVSIALALSFGYVLLFVLRLRIFFLFPCLVDGWAVKAKV